MNHLRNIAKRGGLVALQAANVWRQPSPAAPSDPFLQPVVKEPTESALLLDGGEQAYPRMLEAIAQAKCAIHLEVYAFSPNGIGAKFIHALADARKRGVEVQVMIDGWGSVLGGRDVAAALRAAGCEVTIYNRILALFIGRFARNHRKLLIVDDDVAFLGGINIGDENLGDIRRLGWADLALEIRGPQCARLRQMIRGEKLRPIHTAVHISLSGLGGGWRLRRRYIHAFRHARHRIDVAHGYFLPDRRIIRALNDASKRGVQVRLLLAGQSDVPFVRAATRRLYRQLLAAGVSVHEWNGSILHAKVATIDCRCLLVGSFNLDPLSLANLETLAFVTDPDVVKHGQAWIERHFEGAREVTSVEAESWLQRWILDPLGALIARFAEGVGYLLARRR